jgi:hypothetical protein
MSEIKNRLLLLFLEEPKLYTDDSLLKKYREVYGDSWNGHEVYESIQELSRHDQLADFDPEFEAFNDFISVTHKEHGDIEFGDLEIQGMDSFMALGPKSIVTIIENANELAEFAAESGLTKALAHLKNMPIDASKWTGLPTGFKFTKQVQLKVVEALNKARSELVGLGLSNAEHAKASAYIDCALIMAALPDPEPDIIALLIKRFLAIFAVVGVFADLKGIFD